MAPSEIRKAIAAFVGTLLLFLNEVTQTFGFILPADWQHTISGVIAVLTVVATYWLPNTKAVQ